MASWFWKRQHLASGGDWTGDGAPDGWPDGWTDGVPAGSTGGFPDAPAPPVPPSATVDAAPSGGANAVSLPAYLLTGAVPLSQPQQSGGGDPVSDNVDTVVQGDAARSDYGVDGTGIKIGIISDSFNNLGGTAADEADGALPPAGDVHILQDGTGGTDEGRAMAEIAHSIAPGAQIYFYTAGENDSNMATAIAALQQAGCQIIVDDVSFFDEPFFEEGDTISQAIDTATAAGSVYFTAATNAAQSYYEGVFNPTPITLQGGGTTQAENFGTAASPNIWETFTLPVGATAYVILQWNQPFATADGVANGPGSANSLAFNIDSANFSLLDLGTANVIGGDPVQLGEFTNTSSSATLNLAIFMNPDTGPVPGQFKVVIDDNSFSPVKFTNGGVGSGAIFGHEEDPNAISVGAVPVSNPTKNEVFSSYGPGEFLFDSNGNPLTTPLDPGKPNVSAPDGNSTSLPNDLATFYGTSAASPAAAAVGALMLDANGALDANDVANLLADSATPLTGSANVTGAGLVDAVGAVGLAATLVFTETASAATLLGTHLNDSFVGGPGSHAINGEGGVNTLDYSAAPAAVSVNFVTGVATNGYGGTDDFSNFQIAKGSAHNDSFVASAAGETLFGGGGLDNLDFAALLAGGTLALDGGSFAAAADSTSNAGSIDLSAASLQIGGAFANAGTLKTLGGGGLTLAGALANNGQLVADGGSITVGGAITGTGSVTIETGATLAVASDAEAVSFAGAPASLVLDAPQSFTGTIAGLADGDILDFANTDVTGDTIVGSTLSVDVSGGQILTYQIAGALAGNVFAPGSDGGTGTDLTFEPFSGFSLAAATVAPASPIALGNARIGGTLARTLSIANSAAPPAESLDATLAGSTGDATESGAISLLAAQATDSSSITVGLGTAAAGAQSGSVTLGFLSDGQGIDGGGTTALPSQTVQLSGAVYREAAPSVAALPANFIVHVGDTVAQPLAIANADPADGYSENLIATVGGTSGGVTAAGSTGDIAAQATSTAIALGFSTAQAGTVSGGVTVNFQSDGTGIDGFAPAGIGGETIPVDATIDNYAVAAIEELSGGGSFTQTGTRYTLNLGTVAAGAAPITVDLGILNNVAGPADLLSGNFATTGSTAFTLAGFGAFSGLAAGQADTQPSVVFNPGAAGTFTETITLDPTGSNASGYSNPLAAETLTITGTVASSFTWNGPGSANRSGSWNAAADWSPALVPSALSTATISNAGSYTIASSQSNSIGTLTLSDTAATLAVTGGTFSILASSTNKGQIAVADGADLLFTGTLTNSGKIALNSTGDATGLIVAGSASLKGGVLAASDSAGNGIHSTGAAATLTVGTGTTISGAGTVGDSTLTLINQSGAIIDASGAANALTIATGANILTNSGTLEATGTGGLVIASTVNGSAGGIIKASGAGAVVTLSGGTIDGGTLQTAAGGLIDTAGAASLLSGVTSIGLLAVSDGTALTFKGTITNNGTFGIDSSGDATSAMIAGGVTLKGALYGMTDFAGNAIQSNGAAATLTISAGTTIAGSGTIGDANLSIANQAGGIIDATGVNSALIISTGARAVANTGKLEATGTAGLTIFNTTITGGAGSTIAAIGAGVQVDLIGATINGGTLQTSAGGTIAAAGSASVLSGVTSTGAVTVGDGTALTLKGTITNTGSLTVASTGDGASLLVAGAATVKGSGPFELTDNAGNAILSNGAAATLTNSTGTTIAGSGTIGDANLSLVNQAGGIVDATGTNAALVVTGAHAVNNSGILEATGAAGLTLLNTTITGGAGSTIAAIGAGVQVGLNGATLNAGTLQTSAGGTIAAVGTASVLNGVTSTGAVTIGDGTALTLKGTVTNNGVLTVAAAGDGAALVIAGAVTVKGSGPIDLTDNAGNAILSNGAAATLTNSAGMVIAGAGTIGDGLLALTNQAGGIVDATGAHNALTLATGAKGVSNSGTLEATGSAGLVILNTIVTGTLGSTIAALGGAVRLSGATLSGGTLQSSSGGTIASAGTASLLSGVTNAGSVTIGDGTALSLKGAIVNSGTIGLASTGDATELEIVAATTLSGSGQVALSDAAQNAIVTGGAAMTLTNGSTIAGSGKIGDGLLTLVNQAAGTIDATGTAAALTIATGAKAVTNSGLIEATGAAGLTILNSTITGNAGSVVAASGGNVALSGATLNGGTLETSGGSTIDTLGAASVLSGVTSTGSIAVGDDTALTLKGNVTDNGEIGLDSSGDATKLIVAGTVGLAGSGGLLLSDFANNSIVSNGSAATLNSAVAIAGSGTIGDTHLTLDNLAAGTIDATGTAAALTINTGANKVTNGGLIEATGSAGLTVAGALANNGSLVADGGALTVAGALTGTGAATIETGTLDFAASVVATAAVTFAQGAVGTLELGTAQSFAGTVAGLASGDGIDLANFQFSGAPTINSIANIVQSGNDVGVDLTIKDGALTASVSLLNQFGVQYTTNPGDYTLTSDLTGARPGTLLQLAAHG